MNNRNNVLRNILDFAHSPAAVVAVLFAFFFSELNRDAFCTAQDDLAVSVDALVRRLDSPIRNERDDAERALLEKGPGVLPFLPSETMLISAEVRLRLDRIRRTLENESFLDLQTSPPIPIPEGRTTVGRIAEELTSLSGNRVESTEEISSRVIDWTNPAATSFWPTIDCICELSGSRFERSSFDSGNPSSKEGLGLLLTAIDSAAEPETDPTFAQVEYFGPFRVMLQPDWPETGFAPTETISGESETFRLETTLWWEPRLRVVRLDVPHANYSGRDEKGSRFKARTPDAVLEIPVDGKALSKNWTIGMEVEDDPATEDAVETTRFATQFEAIVLGGDHDFIFEDASRYPATQTFGDVTIVLEQVRRTTSGWEFDVRVTYAEAHGVFASHYAWYYANRAALLDRKGENELNIDASNSMMRRQFDDGFIMTYVFRQSPEILDGLQSLSFSYTASAFLRSLRIDSQR